MSPPPNQKSLRELAGLFLKLGVIGFGGPAAHIAMMEDEVVERRGWLSRERFLDMVGATNLIPGPNSTEMAIHIGYAQAGMKGLLVAGASFIFPAVLITIGLAWVYVEYGTIPAAEPVLAGIRPVVVAIVSSALWKLSRKAMKGPRLWFLALAIAAAVGIGSNEILALLAGGIIAMLTAPPPAPTNGHRATGDPSEGAAGSGPTAAASENESSADTSGSTTSLNAAGAGLLAAGLGKLGKGTVATAALIAATGAVSLTRLFLYFLTIGSVLYGSGYVLFAYIEGGLVGDLGWLTRQQLIDAVAIGQFTPGPVLSTATFVGYLVAGPMGAVVATAGIFLPSFVFVGLLARILPMLRASRRLGAFLDGLNASAVALMAVVTLKIATSSFTGWETVLLGVVAAVATFGFRVNAAFLVVGGAAAGWLFL